MPDFEQLGLPSPSDEPTGGQADHASGRANGWSGPRKIRTPEECLSVLDQLAGLVVLGHITPARANTIRGLMHEMLAFYQYSSSGSTAAMPIDGDMLERLRNDPQLMNMMAPLFTKEQITELMGNSSDGPRA